MYRNIYRIGGRDLSYLYDSNIFMIYLGNKEYVLIDVGSGQGILNLLNNMLELGVSPYNIKYIFLTHAHYHAAGASWWFSRTPALIIAHEPDASFIRKGDNKYTGADEFDVTFIPATVSISIKDNVREYKLHTGNYTITVIHTPGHTKGSISILFEDDGNNNSFLFVGDSLLNILSRKWLSSEEDFKETVDKVSRIVEEKHLEVLCTSVECFRGYSTIKLLIEKIKKTKPIWV